MSGSPYRHDTFIPPTASVTDNLLYFHWSCDQLKLNFGTRKMYQNILNKMQYPLHNMVTYICIILKALAWIFWLDPSLNNVVSLSVFIILLDCVHLTVMMTTWLPHHIFLPFCFTFLYLEMSRMIDRSRLSLSPLHYG